VHPGDDLPVAVAFGAEAARHDQQRPAADEASIPVLVGDMATTTAPGEYTLVYLVFNTIANLLSQAEQVACFHNAARHLWPDGRFVIELWVPDLRSLPPGRGGRPSWISWPSWPDSSWSPGMRTGAARSSPLSRDPTYRSTAGRVPPPV
jgi:hypothetical protein